MLKGYVLHKYLWIIRWENGYTTTLPLEVFTHRNSVAKKSKKSLSEPHFGGLRSNIRTASTYSSLERT